MRKSYKLFLLSVVALVSCALTFNACTEKEDDIAGGYIERISFKTMPKVAYVLGKPLDLSGAILTLHKTGGEEEVPFSNFSSYDIEMEPANGTNLEFSHESVRIVHTPSGKGLIQPLDITNNVVAIKVKIPPTEVYLDSDPLDLSSLVLTLVKENGSEEELAFADFGSKVTCTPENRTVLSLTDANVNVVFNSTEVETNQEIQVASFAPTALELVNAPINNEYDIGDFLNTDGLQIKATMANGIEKIIDAKDLEQYGFVMNLENEQKLGASDNAILISHSGISVSVPLTINPLLVTGMKMKIKPKKISYKEGEAIDLAGAIITLTVDGQGEIDVKAEDFATYGIVASPSNRTAYEASMEKVTFSYPGYDKTVFFPLGVLFQSNFAEDGLAGWGFNENGGGSFKREIKDGELWVTDIVKGANGWDVQLQTPTFTLEKGQKYSFTMEIKAAPGHGDNWFGFTIGKGGNGWGGWPGVWLTNSDKFTKNIKTFEMTEETASNIRMTLSVGNNTKEVIIKSIKIEKMLE